MKEKVLLVTKSILYRLKNEDIRIMPGFQLHTTDFISRSVADSQCIIPNVYIHEFSEKEMVSFTNFWHSYDNCKALGVVDGSAIYYAWCNHHPILTIDKVTEKVCTSLNIAFVRLENILDKRMPQMIMTSVIHSSNKPERDIQNTLQKNVAMSLNKMECL